jgi:hypothetical protein
MRATAQTIYPFTGNYRTTVNIEPISGNVSKVFEVGLSDDAPYDLGLYEGLTYSVLDANGNLTFNNNPEVFGVQGFPQGYIVFGCFFQVMTIHNYTNFSVLCLFCVCFFTRN